MGFNKRFINLENLLYRYQMNNDIEDVKNYVLKPDALSVNMDSSRYIVDKIIKGDDYGALLIIQYELNRQGLS